jgi:thiol-disulfide isomerase/thioredoxin
MASVVTPQRFASGMTFDEYVAYIGSPENLAREGSGGSVRRDFSGFFREAFDRSRLSDAQLEALQWLRAQPGGPAKVLVISEDWSSDCRRDVPALARMAAEAEMELRIFRRDGQKFSAANLPSLAGAPDSNADIMAEFLKHKNGQTWQSIPVAVFYTDDLTFLYRYQEYPATYEKDSVVGKIREPLPGESAEATAARTGPLFQALQDSAFFRVWACAAIDEIISALHRRLLLGEA